MPAVYSPQFSNDYFNGKVDINTGIFINGEWVEGSSGTFIEYAAPTLYLIKLTPSLLPS